jgi:hypothetical protein
MWDHPAWLRQPGRVRPVKQLRPAVQARPAAAASRGRERDVLCCNGSLARELIAKGEVDPAVQLGRHARALQRSPAQPGLCGPSFD